ncbi:MAG: SDR family oxidoreductase [Actinomycetota bacterium]|nr:SDR family oxidoreductase [Actinomycetota bacterium]
MAKPLQDENGPRARRVVVVTGASAGVGRAVARALADRGDAVALFARGEEGLSAAARDVDARGGRSLALQVDVADAAAVEAAAARVEHDLGPIDVWVNNAMVSVFAPFKEISAADYRRVTEVTYLGYVHGTMSALSRMLPRDRGVVVQVGSALAYRAIPLQSAYCGAKHAVEGFTESLRCELAHDRSNVRVVMVQLPAINTPQFHWVKTSLTRHPQPVPPIFQPEVAAEAIVWAAEHPRREYWVGWPTARAVIANRVVPGVLDRYLARSGVDAQQADRPIEADRPHNLYDPLAGDFGAHGEFDDVAKDRSVYWRAARRRGALGAAGASALAYLGWRRRGPSFRRRG